MFIAIAALVCGILGIVGGFIPVVNYFTLVLAILGIVFGVKARKQSAEAQDGKQGMATAGLVCGIVGAAFGVVGIICVLCAAGSIAAGLGSLA